MIPSLDQRSQAEVWREFTSLLGENCNTISSTGDCDNNSIILPGGVDVDAVKRDLTRTRGERYLLILNHLYFRGIYRRKTAKESGNFLPVNRDSLVQIGGNRYSKLLKYGTDTTGQIIKSPKTYIVGGRCNEYRLSKDVMDLSRQQTYVLTVKAAIGVWKNREEKRRMEFVSKGPAHQKIADGVSGLCFDYRRAFAHVAGMADPDKQRHRITVLTDLITNGQTWSVDKQGRNYTILVIVPRDIRQFFSYHGQPLFAIDIKSSQPLLHSLLYPDGEPELPKYLSAVQTDFWEFINRSAGSPYDLTDPEQKDLLKGKMWSQVFYGWKEEKPKPNALFARTFEREFPVLWSEIQKTKSRGNKPLPREMQFLEANQVLSAVGRLVGESFPLITIHDCIVTTKDGIEPVKTALLAEFAQWKLKPALTVKQVTV